jgi:hypothetical protein
MIGRARELLNEFDPTNHPLVSIKASRTVRTTSDFGTDDVQDRR